MNQPQKQKTPKQLERHFKEIANHRRLEILFLINSNSGLTLEEISRRLSVNFKTISGHTDKLVRAGLLDKKYRGREVEHYLSPYGLKLVRLVKTF